MNFNELNLAPAILQAVLEQGGVPRFAAGHQQGGAWGERHERGFAEPLDGINDDPGRRDNRRGVELAEPILWLGGNRR